MELPEAVREEDVCAEAALRGLALEGFSAFRQGLGDGRSALVISYGADGPHLLRTALRAAVDSVAARTS
ncbi:hypothetical protein [Nocardiopsis valliformis]|uniref:hypothetical protein n=1 Tax=Nocardiopsis valliformis TaxID=239974 RepID=UPI0003469C9E|nr:hypothetical protein [Nocardiopsis valliformis]